MSNDDFNKKDTSIPRLTDDEISRIMEMSSSDFDDRILSQYQKLTGKKFNSFSIEDAMKMANFETEMRIRLFKQFAEKDLQMKFDKWFKLHKKSIFQTIIQEMRQGRNEMTKVIGSDDEQGGPIARALWNGYEPREKSFKKVSLGMVEDVVENDPGLSDEECQRKFTEFVESKIEGVEVSEISFREDWGEVWMNFTLSW